MPTHVAFLRAINLGATRKFPKDAIVAAAERAGFADVATHLNTGNLRVTGPQRSRAEVESALEEAFLADRGFEVPTVALGTDELPTVLADAEELAAGLDVVGGQYVSLLKHEPTATALAEAEQASYDGEHLLVRGRAVHLVLEQQGGYHKARLSTPWVERRFGTATNRNLTVVRALVEKWC